MLTITAAEIESIPDFYKDTVLVVVNGEVYKYKFDAEQGERENEKKKAFISRNC